jgi:uncharacterized membrane protein
MWLAVATLSCLFVAAIIAAPFASAGDYQALAGTIYKAFSYLCHQIPDRSFFVDEHPFAVCARCTGIYAGFAAAAFFYPLIRPLRQTETPARKWLFLAAAPLAIDWSIEFFGIANNTHTSRFLTGALLGATAVFFVLPGLIELSLREWRKRGPSPKVMPLTTAGLSSDSAPSDYSAPHRRI